MPVVIEEFEVALQEPRPAEAAAPGAMPEAAQPLRVQDAIEAWRAREAERACRLSDA
jgi:hypothetical protein